jgi:predicted extracellular nuclease
MKKFYTLLTIILISTTSQAQIVISQIYGGGGNTGATYSNDFIELFNRSSTAVNVNGWSVQYASANGTTWAVTALPNVSIQPGKYYLIQEAVGAAIVLALPTPDLDGASAATTGTNGLPQLTGIAMSGSNGKVILVNSTTAETTADPTGSRIIDKVAYGTTSTSGFEGTGPTGVALTNSTAAIRNNAGCTDSNNNAADFTAATPTPRNSSTATNTCPLAVKQNAISGLSVYPNPVTDGNLYITSDSSEAKTVAVYDILGKQVLNAKTSNNAVNVSSLKGGAYIVKITEEGKTDTRKLIIE